MANIKNKKYVYFHDTSYDTCTAMWNKNKIIIIIIIFQKKEEEEKQFMII